MISFDPKLPLLDVPEKWLSRFVERFYLLWRELYDELKTTREIATSECWASYYPGSFNVPTNTGRLFIDQMILVGAETASAAGTATIRIV